MRSETFCVAIITPGIHDGRDGLEIDVNPVVLDNNGKAITGLYAAGEVTGGVRSNNRLGGDSSLVRIDLGRMAGKHAAKYMLGQA